jgi:hypothetical protein
MFEFLSLLLNIKHNSNHSISAWIPALHMGYENNKKNNNEKKIETVGQVKRTADMTIMDMTVQIQKTRHGV